MKRTEAERKTSFVGNGQLGVVQTASMSLGDTVHPCISIGSEIGGFAGEDPRKRVARQTIAIDNDGGTSELRVILKRYCVDETGSALGTGESVVIDGTTYTTGASGVITHNIDGNTYTTLHDLIDAINALPGFVCFIGDALTTHDTGTNDFIDLAETNLPNAANELLDTLYRDVSEDDLAYVRIGLPRKFDMAPIQIIGLSGNTTGYTTGTYTGALITDNMSEYKSDGSHQEVAYEFTPVDDTLTEHIDDDILRAGDYRGSLVLKVAVGDATAADYKVRYRQVLGC